MICVVSGQLRESSHYSGSVFRYFLTSIIIVPVLLGVFAASYRDGAHARLLLRVGWTTYAVLWFGMLYYLRHRW